jgi:C1A family cysteine protease
MIQKHVYGCKKDPDDKRDLPYKVSPFLKLPKKVSLREFCSPVVDQGPVGSCTAHAGTGMMELLIIKYGLPVTQFSRIFTYYTTRMIEGVSPEEDSGCYLRNTMKSLAKTGACEEAFWADEDVANKFKLAPPEEAYLNALNHQILQYNRLSISDLKACLASGFPFVCGIDIYQSFESTKVSLTGKVPMPKRGEAYLGGHAVLCVGYNDAMRNNGQIGHFIFKNSWGPMWGNCGYFFLPYNYLFKYGSDFWTVKTVEGI